MDGYSSWVSDSWTQSSGRALTILVPVALASLEVDERAVPESSLLRSELTAVQLAVGYQSDKASGEDQLDIRGEVNAVCEVITDPAVTPPIAIGYLATGDRARVSLWKRCENGSST